MEKLVQIERVKLLDSDLEKRILSGPLSRETTFSLHLRGPVRAEHIERIIQLLQMQKQWLEPAPPESDQPEQQD